jgi:hypothetical protein
MVPNTAERKELRERTKKPLLQKGLENIKSPENDLRAAPPAMIRLHSM